MEQRKKREKLYALAEQDLAYQAWKKAYEECIGPFREFVSEQPEDIRNVLYGYADGGRMMLQKIINIACKKMEFIDDPETQ